MYKLYYTYSYQIHLNNLSPSIYQQSSKGYKLKLTFFGQNKSFKSYS
jgi:hypothetical protein